MLEHYDMVGIMIFNSIADEVDGTTDLLRDHPLETGYWVGGAGAQLTFDSLEQANRSTSLKVITDFVRTTQSRFLGWWTDRETGMVHVDEVSWYAEHDEAAKVARQRRELAFYDISRQREIRLAYVDGELED